MVGLFEEAKLLFLLALGIPSFIVFCVVFAYSSAIELFSFWQFANNLFHKKHQKLSNFLQKTKEKSQYSRKNITDSHLLHAIEHHFQEHPASHTQLTTARAVADVATAAERTRCASIVADIWAETDNREVELATQLIVRRICGR